MNTQVRNMKAPVISTPVIPTHLKWYANQLQAICQDELISVMAYPDKTFADGSEIQLMAVVYEVSLPLLQELRPLIASWEEKNIKVSFIGYWELLDCPTAFSAQLMQMMPSYHCIYGQDLLADLELNWETLHVQVESGLRHLLYTYRTEYLHDGAFPASLRLLLADTYQQLRGQFKGLLQLKGLLLQANSQQQEQRCLVEAYEMDKKALRLFESLRDPFAASRLTHKKVEGMALLLEQLLMQLIEAVNELEQPVEYATVDWMAI